MGFFDYFTKPEILAGDFLLPWGMVIGILGFLTAWLVIIVMERMTWTRHIWHLPLFFVALTILFGSVIGLILAP